MVSSHSNNTWGFCFFFGCAGYLLLCRLFSSCGKLGLLSRCRVQASHCSGFSRCGALVRGLQLSWLSGSRAQVQWLWRMGLAAPWHMDLSGWNRTCVSCTGRRIPYHWATRESPIHKPSSSSSPFPVQFSGSVVSDSLWSLGLQHASLPFHFQDK